jgi:hypothetical protein
MEACSRWLSVATPPDWVKKRNACRRHASDREAALAPLPGCDRLGMRSPVVSLRSTTGYKLSSLRDRCTRSWQASTSSHTRSAISLVASPGGCNHARLWTSLNVIAIKPVNTTNEILAEAATLHVPPTLSGDIVSVLKHPDFPTEMTLGGRLEKNPFWTTYSDQDLARLKKTYGEGGALPIKLVHMDFLLIKKAGPLGHGHLFTYRSPGLGQAHHLQAVAARRQAFGAF